MTMCELCGKTANYYAKSLSGSYCYMCDRCFDLNADVDSEFISTYQTADIKVNDISEVKQICFSEFN